MKVEAGRPVKRSCRFGLRLGPDLVVAVVVLCGLFIKAVAFGSGLDIAVAVSQKNEIKIVQPKKGAHISGKIHIKFKVGQNIKKVFVFINDKYFASGPPYNILWNSATASNGPHRITVVAATPAQTSNALFLASQSQETTEFFVYNRLLAPSATTLTSTLVLTSANNGQSFSNYRISTMSGACVTINGASNITITRSNIGPCGGSEGATTNADSNGVELIQGSRTSNIQIVDNYIHTDTFPGNPCTQQQHTGIMDQSITSGTANLFQGNVIAYGGKGIHVNDGGVGDQSIGNFIINQREDNDISPCEQGNAIESNVPGALINQNYAVECTVGAGGEGTGETNCSSIPGLPVTPTYSEHLEDNIAADGSPSNPTTVSSNYEIGGRSGSATCYLIPDGNTSTIVTNNVGINCGGNEAAMLGLSGGVGAASGNLLFSNTNTNINSAASVDGANFQGASPYTWRLSNNKIDMLTGDGAHNGLYCGGYCSDITLTNNYIGTSLAIPFPTLTVTSTVAQIEAVLGAPPLIPPVPKNCVIESPFTTQRSKPAC